MNTLQHGSLCARCGGLVAQLPISVGITTTRSPKAATCAHRSARKHIKRSEIAQRRQLVSCRAGHSLVSDADLIDAINEVSNSTLRAMLANDKRAAASVAGDLEDMRDQSLDAGDNDSAAFLKVLGGMLDHRIIADAEHLEGLYAQAFNRICNQVAGSDWQLAQDGQPENPEEPRFSSWEEALGGGRKQQFGDGGSQAAAAASPSLVKDDTYYRVLDVAATASAADIKSAFRSKALKLHPDVNSAPDAEARFMELSLAYDVLSNAESRALYDRYGANGMKQHQGSGSGHGNARDFWEEFKPFKRENKRTRARDAAAAAAAPSGETEHAAEADGRFTNSGEEAQLRKPETGDVVEYPLSEVVQRDLQDGRSHGVALLVGRNIDRGDAGKLPQEVLDLCEVEPLRQEEPDSAVWIPDELQPSAYVRLGDLRIVPVAAFDRRFDAWRIEASLSEGCGGPELPEEVML